MAALKLIKHQPHFVPQRDLPLKRPMTLLRPPPKLFYIDENFQPTFTLQKFEL